MRIFWLIQYQILRTTIIRIVWQTVKRITDEILSIKGLNCFKLGLSSPRPGCSNVGWVNPRLEWNPISYLKALTLQLPDQICNSPYCQPHNSYNVSSENLVWNQLIIPKLIVFFILVTYLVYIVWILLGEFFLGHSW